MSNMRRVVGAYHVAMFPVWHDLVRIQCERIKESGLLDRTSKLLVGVVGASKEDTSILTDLLGSKACVRYLGPLSLYEFSTLQWLYDEIRLDDVACWYAHTKGISAPTDIQTAWRLRMESVVFDQYEKCLDALETHDTCGNTWYWGGLHDSKNFHYSGNFWWANSSYLQTLPEPLSLRSGKYGRFEAEFWIGKNPAVKPLSLDAKE